MEFYGKLSVENLPWNFHGRFSIESFLLNFMEYQFGISSLQDRRDIMSTLEIVSIIILMFLIIIVRPSNVKCQFLSPNYC